MTAPTVHLTEDGRGGAAHPLTISVRGRQLDDLPHVVVGELQVPVVPTELLPTAAVIVSSYEGLGGAELLAEHSGRLIHVEAYGEKTTIAVASAEQCAARATVDDILHRFSRTDSRLARIGIWHHSNSCGPRISHRFIEARRWTEVERNYPGPVQRQLEELTQLSEPSLDSPRLILFHGEPGTGKTNAIRALFDAWRSWCEPQLISDPDRMFADADYLHEVLNKATGADPARIDRAASSRRWKLLVAEDGDEYLRSTARRDAGAALGRLLNTTDGMLGQSHPLLVLLTTNEEIARLHPALTRPGRCLASVEFTRFSHQEALSWLPARYRRHLPASGATLAELFELTRSGVHPAAPLATGEYI